MTLSNLKRRKAMLRYWQNVRSFASRAGLSLVKARRYRYPSGAFISHRQGMIDKDKRHDR